MAGPMNLQTHRKFKLVLHELRGSGADGTNVSGPLLNGHLSYLWRTSWMEDSPYLANEEEAEIVMEWEGEPGSLAAALIKRGFLDRTEDDRLEIHNWAKHAPNYIKEKWKKRTQRKGRSPADVPVQSQDKQGTQQGHEGENLPPSHPISYLPIVDRSAHTHNHRSNTKRGQDRDAVPTKVGDLMGDGPWAELPPPEEWIQDLASRLVAHRGIAWAEWFQVVLTRYHDAGNSLRDVEDLLKNIQDSHDPSKDVGQFREPGKWLVKKLCALMRPHKLRWPTMPEGVKV